MIAFRTDLRILWINGSSFYMYIANLVWNMMAETSQILNSSPVWSSYEHSSCCGLETRHDCYTWRKVFIVGVQ